MRCTLITEYDWQFVNFVFSKRLEYGIIHIKERIVGGVFMAFGYLIGVVLFGVLYFLGMKIFNFFDPEPDICPLEEDYDLPKISCVLTINGNSFDCVKQQHIHKDYYYSADCDIMEYSIKHTKYILGKPLKANDVDKTFLSCEVLENGKTIKCYAATNRNTLISYEPEKEERVYSYRRPFKRKKVPA